MQLIESQTIEFKQLWKDEYLKTIFAFANTDGGVLYIGICDDGDIAGVEKVNSLLEILPNKINNRLGLLIDIRVKPFDGKDVVLIEVAKTYAPVSFNGKFYKRSGSNTIELNGSNLTNFLLQKYGKTWDDIVVDNFTIDDINLETIENFKIWSRKRAPFIEEEKDLKRLLEKLNLYEGSHLKRAAVLLFGKDPQRYFIQSHSKIGRFLSDSELLTSDIVEGNLFEQLEKIIEILRTKYLHSYISYDGLNRVETLEYPYEAVREIIINALIHRDYSDTTVLQIRVYDNKIVFTNGATLSHEVPIEKFKVDHLSKPYNPLIANIFYKAGFVESWGKGTNNIVEDCIKMQLPEPDYKYTQHAVQVFIYKATPKTTKERLVEFIKEDSYITRELLAEKLGITINGVKQHILNLKKDNILKRVGGRKDGF
ncbi:MAG: AAA family ATPase, partial [Epsilonproteobacteria bacterium]